MTEEQIKQAIKDALDVNQHLPELEGYEVEELADSIATLKKFKLTDDETDEESYYNATYYPQTGYTVVKV